MDRRTVVAIALGAVVVAALAVVGYGQGLYEYPGEDDHDRAVVTLVDANGTELATLRVRVADTRKERIRGLSGAESLPNGSGMLFVHDEEARQAYVMREMDFPLDLVFVGADGRVTTIHSAPTPEPGTERLERYAGRAKYVLEVPRGYAERVGLDEGDRVRIRFLD